LAPHTGFFSRSYEILLAAVLASSQQHFRATQFASTH
jgi:hypothetical protein